MIGFEIFATLCVILYGHTDAATPVRLTHGETDDKYNGLLEIRHEGVWGTACGANLNASAAKVVCNMLNYSSAGAFSYYFHSDFVSGTPIRTWLTEVECSGSEIELADCTLGPWGVNSSECLHYWDVGVQCTNKMITDVRLTGGRSRYEGRVEVLYDGQWGTVCDREFTDAAAAVVCRMLNVTTDSAMRLPRNYHLSSSPPKQIWLDEVQCSGFEPSLSLCRHNRMGDHFCTHQSDAVINCFAERPYYRIVAGNTSYEGRLEVYHNATWGTVCDDGWRTPSARVVCAMLGYKRSDAVARTYGYFGEGTGPIWLNEVQCQGFETSLEACTRFPWAYAHCTHREDAGVTCSKASLPDNFILYAEMRENSSAIVRMDLSSEMYVTIFESDDNDEIADVDYDPGDGRVYWISLSTGSGSQIKSIGIDGTGETVVHTSANGSVPENLAIDPSLRQIFYTDVNNGDIARMSLDGSNHMLIVHSDSLIDGGLALDVKQKMLYWATSNEIKRANYDGSNISTVVDSGIDDVRGIAVDVDEGILYWASSSFHTLESIHLDGTNRSTVYASSASRSNFTDLDLLKGQLYFSDKTQRTLVRVPVAGGLGDQLGPPTSGIVYAVRMYGSSHRPVSEVSTGLRLINGSSTKYGVLEARVNGVWVGVCADSIDTKTAEVICRSMGLDRYGISNDSVRLVNYHGSETNVYTLLNTNCTGHESRLSECDVVAEYNGSCAGNRDVIIDCAPSLEDIIHLQCTTTGWRVSVDMNKLKYRFPGSRPEDIYLGDNSCTGVMRGTNLVFNEDFGSCLTSETQGQGSSIYVNQLINAYRDPAHPFEIRSFNWSVELTCSNNNLITGHVTTFNQSASAVNHPNVSSNYQLEMEYYTDPNFMQKTGGRPLTVAEGAFVYTKVYVTQADWSIKMKLTTCYTTSSDGASVTTYFLIKNGCEVDANTHFISESMHETKFVFQLFEKTTSHDHVYLNCRASYCDIAQSGSLRECEEQCTGV